MSKFAKALRDEVTRLARKEIRRATLPLKARVRGLERGLSAQRRRVEAVSRQAAPGPRSKAGAGPAAVPRGPAIRLSARNIRRQRERLRLTQADFARLVGVTPVAVYLWEAGRTRPRGKSRTALAAARGLGVREARRRLAETPRGARPAATRRRVRRPARKKPARKK